MTFTTNVTNEQIQNIVKRYQEYHDDNITNNNYTLFRAKIKSTTLTIFKTGKLMLQGSDIMKVQNEIEHLLNIKETKVQNESKAFLVGKNIIGTDEVGTGDYFGGIVVCASIVPKDKILELTKMGIKDSKEISDEKIQTLGKYLIDNIDHTVILLNNTKYNRIFSKNMNMNRIKAILHNKVIINFLNKYPNTTFDAIIIDGFCSKEKYNEYLEGINETYKSVQLIEKAENKYISVAASSIIARYYFLKHLSDLSKKSGYQLLKGASNSVDKLANKIIKEKGIDYLCDYAKMNFKNTKKAVED